MWIIEESLERNSQQPTCLVQRFNNKNLPEKPLNIAALKGQIGTVIRLLDSRANPEEKDGYYGNTGIHWAVLADNIEILELYLERGFNMSVNNDSGWTPIQIAAHCSRCKSLKWLLKNGADIESEDSFKQTSLYKAVLKRHITAAKILLSHGASQHCMGVKHHTILHVAAINGQTKMVKLLAEQGADVKQTDRWDRNLLHVSKTLPLLEWLIGQGLDINGRDDWGRTPLHNSVQSGNLENARFLLHNGADTAARDRHGCTPIYEAAKKGKTELVKLLSEKGADPESRAEDGSIPAEVANDNTIKKLLLKKKQY